MPTLVKVVTVGNTSVGKTTMINYATESESEAMPTIGGRHVNFEVCRDDGKRTSMIIWDTAGSDTYRTLIPMYIRDSSLCLLVYDITNLESFQDLAKWFSLVNEHAPSYVKYIIVGNKKDLEDQRAVDPVEVEKFASEIGNSLICTIEVSGLTGAGIKDGLLSSIANADGLGPVNTPGEVTPMEYLEPVRQKSLTCC